MHYKSTNLIRIVITDLDKDPGKCWHRNSENLSMKKIDTVESFLFVAWNQCSWVTFSWFEGM